MNKLTTATARKTPARSFTAVLAVAAMIALMGAAKTARAWDQQATEAQMDNEINHSAAGGHAANSQHVFGAYASTRSPAHIRGIGVAVPTPQRDFQLEGR